MFANMCADTKWDVDGEMLWGYFFTDTDSSPDVSHADWQRSDWRRLMRARVFAHPAWLTAHTTPLPPSVGLGHVSDFSVC